ncbi:MFS transporter [Nocardia sp. NPDC004568]|uniref:MFS transporter n=1 Tax=Nocardia sp. NPDC004568 TaxID=3154551 RepID=UPI0033A30405
MVATDLPAKRQALLQSLRSALFGNALEYFDWTIYATFSPFIAVVLFDDTDPTSAMLLTLAIFAVAFVIRPIGGAVFGRIADRRGRKSALVGAMLLMGLGSLVLAVIPPYTAIGVGASVLLLFARLLQGLAYGGESSTSYVYVSELAPPRRRGLWSSTVFASVTVGAMAGTLCGFVLTSLLTQEELRTWGWRVPFLVGSLLAVYALWMRVRSIETEVGSAISESESEHAPAVRMSRVDKRRALLDLLRLFIILGATNIAFYTWLSFASSYAISSLGMDSRGAFTASLCAQALTLGLFPVFGHLSDRFGRKPVAIFATIGFGVVTFPLSALLGASPITLFVAQSIALVFWAAVGSIWPAILSEAVSPGARAIGIGITTSMASGVFGGTAPYLNTWLTSLHLQWVFSTYLVVLMVIATLLLATIRETRGIDLLTMDSARDPDAGASPEPAADVARS